MLSLGSIEEVIKRHNLISAGISEPELSNQVIKNFQHWLKSGYNGEMTWLERNLNVHSNIKSSFPWVKSILVVADNYYCPYKLSENSLKISRYSWGVDYHKVVKEKLNGVLAALRSVDSEIDGKIYVDTGPFHEKSLAVNAGLGWQGKNSLIINDKFGSFFFLGIILLNVDVEQGLKVDSRCGGCEKCIKSCPTGAIIEPYIVDARKCISYLTIEKKGEIDNIELNRWIYGCDICQEVCPFNVNYASLTNEVRYFDRLRVLERSLNEWLELAEEEFNYLFKNSAVERLKFDRFRRNILALL